MDRTAKRRNGQRRSGGSGRRGNASVLQEIMWMEQLQGIEAHAERCGRAPEDPEERKMFTFAAFIRADGGSRREALEELLEVRQRVGSPISEARLKEAVNAAYDHPDEPGACRG